MPILMIICRPSSVGRHRHCLFICVLETSCRGLPAVDSRSGNAARRAGLGERIVCDHLGDGVGNGVGLSRVNHEPCVSDDFR